MAKFGQNEVLRAFLLGTGDQVLVEASPHDRIWGIGLKATDEKAKHPATWEGANLPGFALMDVRAQLSGNTLDAHRLIWRADKQGVQDAIVEAADAPVQR